MNWWRRWWHRDRLEHELDAELRFHVDRLVDENIRAGVPPEAARRAARRDFGGVEQVKEDCRDARATRWAHDLGQDLRFAARLLAKDRAFTGLAVMALALGIGVNNAFFAIVNAMCLRGPLEHASRLVHVGTVNAAGVPGGVSHAEFDDLLRAMPSFERAAAYATAPVAVSDDGVAAERATAAHFSAAALEVADEVPSAGRGFDAADHRAGAAAVALIGASLSRRRYGSGTEALGRTIRIDGRPTAVVGVMRGSFRFPNDAEIWLPLERTEAGQPSRAVRSLGVFARLREPATIAGARAELGELSRRLAADHPRSNEGIRLTAVPFNERFTARITDPAWMAFVTAGTLVLLIACANVANLLLARAVGRSAEMAMRASLGATRARLVRQLFVECALLAAVGGAAGLLVSAAGLRLMAAAIPDDALPSWMALTLDGRVLGVLVGVCVAAVLVFGFVPALYTSAASVTSVLRDHSRVRARAGTRRWTTGLLALQFALTSILLTAVVADLLLSRPDKPVFDPSGMLTARITLPERVYATETQREAFYERLSVEMTGIAGVSSSTVATNLPFERPPQRRVVVPGRDSSAAEGASTVGTVAIGARYFETFGVGILRGRDFTRGHYDDGASEAIVNQRFADLYFANEDPLGKRVHLLSQSDADSTPPLTIVGVAPNIRQGRGPDAPLVYRPFPDTWPATAALVLRHRTEDAPVAAALRERVRMLDHNLPLFRTMSMERVIRDSTWNPRVSRALINTISTIALVLAVIGLYGVTAHAVAARAPEIGVRVALGARPRHIRWLVLRRALVQLAVGLPAGAVLTIIWNYVFIVQRGDRMVGLPVLGLVALVIAAIGIAACLVPAERAVRLDPLASIRHE